MKTLIDNQLTQSVQSLNREAAKKVPNFDNALLITEVPELSPAWKLGLRKGDYLLKVSGVEGIDVDLRSMPDKDTPREAVYYLSKSKELLTIKSDGMPLGELCVRSAIGIFNNYAGFFRPVHELWEIWNQSEDELIIQLGMRWQKRKALWFRRKLPVSLGYVVMHDIEYLFAGVALIENKQFDDGLPFIIEFLNELSSDHEVRYKAIGLYYWSQYLERKGEHEEALDTLKEAYGLSATDRIKRALVIKGALSLDHEPEKPWKGKHFPLRYELPMFNNRPVVATLNEYLQAMARHQLLIVCCLGSYRSNGPYDEFMSLYRQIHRYMGDVFTGINVVVGDYKNTWLDNEKAAIQENANVSVLHDPKSELAQALGIRKTPAIYFLAKDGVIVQEELRDDFTMLWPLYLARLGMLSRAGNLKGQSKWKSKGSNLKGQSK